MGWYFRSGNGASFLRSTSTCVIQVRVMLLAEDLRPCPFCATPDTLDVRKLLGAGNAHCCIERQECRVRGRSRPRRKMLP